MEIKKEEIEARVTKLSIEADGQEVARAFLYILTNDLHEEPFGLIEDVFVEEGYREQGYGTKLVQKLIKTAQEEGCYKLICTSRFERDYIHEWYEQLGFKKYGYEFRIDFDH